MKLTKGKVLLAGCMAMAMSHSVLAQDIKVAIVGAMSGPVAQYGDMQFTGARQAIADINASGGIKGDKLVGVEYDDACDPKQAVAVANKVINDGIRYVIGHLCSSSTQPASDIYEDEGVIMITPAATNADLTTRGYKMIMRTTAWIQTRALLLPNILLRRLNLNVSLWYMINSNTVKVWHVPCATV